MQCHLMRIKGVIAGNLTCDCMVAVPVNPGKSVQEPTWMRFGAENVPRTHLHRSGIVFSSILMEFNNCRTTFNATFQNFIALYNIDGPTILTPIQIMWPSGVHASRLNNPGERCSITITDGVDIFFFYLATTSRIHHW